MHSHYCSHQVSGYKRPGYLSPLDNVTWFEIITWSQAPQAKMSEVAKEQQLHAEGTHFLWLQSSTIWSQSFSLWGNGWREVAQCNPAERTWQPVTPKHSLRGSGLSNAYIQSSWDCLASRLGHASEKHDDSRSCILGIKQMVLLSGFFSSLQSLLRTSVHKCYHLFLSLPSWRRKGKVSLLQVLKKKYHQESSVLTWESLKSGLPRTFQ